MKRNLLLVLAVLALTVPSAWAETAVGLGVNVPLVGRLVGGGNTLFRTAIDITNHTDTATQVDFYFTGVDQGTQESFSIVGGVSDSGTLVASGSGTIAGLGNAHFDDIVDALVDGGFIQATTRDAGVIGSLLVVFDGFESAKGGQGSAQARFYNDLAGGTVGVAAKGIEITNDEPKKLIAVARDSRGLPDVPQLYTNIFVNNTGLDSAGSFGTPVTIQFTAHKPGTGAVLGAPLTLPDIGPGETVSVSNVMARLGVPVEERTAIIRVEVVQGDSAIQGLAVQVDATTKDGAIAQMSRADF